MIPVTNIIQFPNDMIGQVFYHLKMPQLMKMKEVCLQFKTIINDYIFLFNQLENREFVAEKYIRYTKERASKYALRISQDSIESIDLPINIEQKENLLTLIFLETVNMTVKIGTQLYSENCTLQELLRANQYARSPTGKKVQKNLLLLEKHRLQQDNTGPIVELKAFTQLEAHEARSFVQSPLGIKLYNLSTILQQQKPYISDSVVKKIFTEFLSTQM